MIEKKVTQKVIFVAMFTLMLGLYGAITVFAAPPNPGGYAPAETLDPECLPGQSVADGDPFDCFVTAGGSGWSLIGDAGTDGGVTNFIGTIDAQDFVIKTNGSTMATFGQDGNIAFSNYNDGQLIGPDGNGNEAVTASGSGAMAWGGSVGTYDYPLASGELATAWGVATVASSYYATAWGDRTQATAENATAWGTSTIASGADATAFGQDTFARGAAETAFGMSGTDYTPAGPGSGFMDRLFTVGNGGLISDIDGNNAYTLWGDGSFAYNDDNFANDDPGTEQNMFYFNFGSHDGEGNAQTKQVIRLGSFLNDESDITSVNVGDKSIVIGFSSPVDLWNASVASGANSIALGACSTASGAFSFVMTGCNTASGAYSQALGSANTASGSFASILAGQNNEASGYNSFAIGMSNTSRSSNEATLGYNGTDYTPNNTNHSDIGTEDPLLEDRLFNIGDGFVSGPTGSDAFTILKNGETGIGIDNFEANTNGLGIFQVGDGATSVIGYVQSGTGNWMAVSDERKKDNIRNLSYGLDTINELSPKSYTMKSNGQESIGFLAQDVLSVIPEAVSGSEEQGYSMAYQVITPVLVNAIQELDLKFSTIEAVSGINTESFFERITTLVQDTITNMTEIIVGLVKADRVETKELCVDGECFTGDDIRILRDIVNERSPDLGDSLDQEIETPQEESLPEETPVPAEGEVIDETPIVEEDSQEPVIIEEVPVIVEESSEVLE